MVTVRKKQLSDIQKAKALAWSQEEVNQNEIARRLGVSRWTVSRLLLAAKSNNNVGVPSRKSGSGRPKKVNNKMLKKIKKDIFENPFLTAKQIKDKNPRLLSQVSLRTIRRVLLENLNLKARVAAKKPVLNSRMKRQRLNFARRYQHWSVAQWDKVSFSDESLFETSMTTKGRLVRRGPGTNRYEKKFTVESMNFPPSLMVWTCFSSRGTGDLYIQPKNKTMDSSDYLKILKKNLMKTMKTQNCNFFQHDNARIHTAKQIVKFLKENNVDVIKWPGYSPDISPIENMFGLMKKQIEGKGIRTIPKLKKEFKKNYKKLKKSYLKNLVKSMPKRLKLVIKNKGEMI